MLTFPSGGDTSYPGLVWHDGRLWMSYYSSHEGKSAIYLAQIQAPLEPEDISSRLEPFVDDYLIDRLSGSARLVVQQPSPREVVLTADKPWEGNTSAYYTVLQDDDRFRMYYRGSHWNEAEKKAAHREVTCYAESNDGIHWTKPELGLFEFDGSKQNNIVWDGPGMSTHCFTPFKDTNPKASRDARYKALTRVKGGLQPLKSPDGIHWQPMSDAPVITKGAFDSQNPRVLGSERRQIPRISPRLSRGAGHHDGHVERLPHVDRTRVASTIPTRRRSISTRTPCGRIPARRGF